MSDNNLDTPAGRDQGALPNPPPGEPQCNGRTTDKLAYLAGIAASVALNLGIEGYTDLDIGAQQAGVRDDEVLGTLIAIAPIVGIPRIVSAAPLIACTLGYDIDADFEELDE